MQQISNMQQSLLQARSTLGQSLLHGTSTPSCNATMSPFSPPWAVRHEVSVAKMDTSPVDHVAVVHAAENAATQHHQTSNATHRPPTEPRNVGSKAPRDGDEFHEKPRVVNGDRVTQRQARDIYALRSKATCACDAMLQQVAGRSTVVATMMSVSPKTVRDIWDRKVFTDWTGALWTDREQFRYAANAVDYDLSTSVSSCKANDAARKPGRRKKLKTSNETAPSASSSAAVATGREGCRM